VIDPLVKRTQWRGIVRALAMLLPISIAVGACSSLSLVQAAIASYPACQASQITVTAGATATNAPYPVRTSSGVRLSLAYELVPVYFDNRGSTCHLLMGAPSVRAVRYTTHPDAISLHDLSAPAEAGNTRRLVVSRHEKLEALFVVVKPAGTTFKGCDTATATGFIVGDYASPIATTHFVDRKLREVCFDTGIGDNVIDYGVEWPSV
jgi:hypothetical protein